MYFYHIITNLIILFSCNILFKYTSGILINNHTLGFLSNNCNINKNKYGFLDNNANIHLNSLNSKPFIDKQTRNVRLFLKSDDVDSTNKYIDNFLKSEKGNLFKTQFTNYNEDNSQLTQLEKSQSWSDIVYDEILKNKQKLARSENFKELFYDEGCDLEVTKEPFDYRLTPEGRLKLEDRIEHLKRVAHSNPINYKPKTPILWIIRSSYGNYCDLLKKDEDKIKSLVDRVRRHFPKSELKILVMKVKIKMPLCEILVEGTMPDLVRILHARGGTLQFYVVPRFWTRCEILDRDPHLQVLYGKATAPGLFPTWDENGMLEEIADCIDLRPDYALEFRSPNAWHLLSMMPEFDQEVMEAYFEKVHWPTRLKVQRAFERGVEDFRLLIEEQYRDIQMTNRKLADTVLGGFETPQDRELLDLWLSHPDDFN